MIRMRGAAEREIIIMKYAIIGAGGTGGILGFYMTKAGKDVTLIARGRHLAAMQEKGLAVEKMWDGTTETIPVKATDMEHYDEQPDVVLVGPNKIQGVVVGEDDTVTLSQSYGRKNNASLLHYSLALGETLDTMLTVQGRDVPGYILDSKRLKESVTAMPMTEALADAKDGGIYVLFESGAIHYANGTFRTDHVWKIKF